VEYVISGACQHLYYATLKVGGVMGIVQTLTVLVTLADCILAFWFPRTAWIVVGLLGAFFTLQLVIIRKAYRLTDVVTFTAEVDALAAKYGHYFLMPFASRDYSASSGTIQFGGVVLAAITWFAGFKLGALFALVTWFAMGYTAHSFSPVAILAKHPEFSTCA
jgi:hypothetical protein